MANVAVAKDPKLTAAKKRAAKTGFHPSPYAVAKALTEGDLFTKASAVVLGLGNIVHKQYVKGAVFLLGEILFLYLFFTSGISCLAKLAYLGPVLKGSDGWDDDGNYVHIDATNSVRELLYAVAWIFLIAGFVLFWVAAVRSAYSAQVLTEKNGRAPTIIEDLKALLDSQIKGSLMALPTLGLITFTVLPITITVLLAFTDADHNHWPPFNWVGFETFAKVFDPNGSVAAGVNLGLFMKVLVWTLVWAFFATFLNFFLGMFMAMVILRKGTRLKGLWRTCFSMSIAVPQFVSLLVIHQMLTDQGILNTMLKDWGVIDTSLPFWTDSWWARVTVIVVNLWIGVPYTIMQITGILQNVPGELYEASEIDGANWWQTFTNITMPYILFVMTPYLITTFTSNVNNFNVIYFLSGGAPAAVGESAGDTDLLITWLYKLTVTKLDYNVGAVIGILTFIVLATVALITYRSSGSYKNEEGFR